MKYLSILMLSLGFLSKGLKAQSTINTYYVIAPTNGCNGVWAIDYSQFSACLGNFPVNHLVPNNCANMQTATPAGDTLFIPLCTMPCNLSITNGNNTNCTCGTGSVASVKNNSTELVEVNIYPNPLMTGASLHMKLSLLIPELSIIIYNSLGEKIAEQKLQNPGTEITVTLPHVSPGNYAVVTTCEKGTCLNQVTVLKPQ